MTTSSEEGKAPPATSGSDDAFVGRSRELRAIRRSLDAAALGHGRLEIVSGAPGIGKTRLAQEVATIAFERGFAVLWGGCCEGEGAPAYWPWADTLRNHLNHLNAPPEADTADFNQLLDVAAVRAGIPVRRVTGANKDAQQARFIVFDRFCDFLAATASRQPLLVIIDDAQSADAGSLLLLQFVAVRLTKLPIAVLITSRDPLPDMAASTTRHSWTRHTVLRGLSRAEARILLRGRATHSPPRAALDRLMHLTEGNPYFLKQLLVHGECGTSSHSIALPASLLVITLQTYHRLSLDCQSLLQAASVIGRDFDADLVASAVRLRVSDALRLLDEAVEQRVVAAVGAARYHFAHALVREAIHDQLHPSDRTRLHESVALALEGQSDTHDRVSAATLAHHFCMALPLTKRRPTALHGITAGEAAHTAFAYEEAVFQFRRAYQVAGTSLTDLESCDLLLRLGAAEAGAGEWAESRCTFEDAAAIARQINCPERLARAALGFKGMMFGTLPVDIEAITLLRAALEQLDQNSHDLRARVYSSLSRALYFADDPDMVNAYNSLAVESARPLNDERLAAELTETRLLANWQPSGFAVVRESADQLLESGIRLHDPIMAFRARTYRYSHFLTIGDGQQAAHEFRQASELASSIQHPRSTWQIALLRAAQAMMRGKLRSATRLATKARELGRRVHDSSPAHHDLVQSFQHVRLSKDYASWLQVATQSTIRYPNTIGYLAAQALLYSTLGHLDESRDVLRHFGSHRFRNIPANNFQLYTLAILSEAVAACDDATWAADLYSLLVPYEALHVVGGWGTAVDGSVAHYLAILASCMGRRDLASAHFHTALDANRRLDAPALLVRTQLQAARFLARSAHREDSDRARQLASSAMRTCSALDLEHFRNECAEVQGTISAASPASVSVDSSYAPDAQNLFRRQGDLWTIRYDGTEIAIHHRLGLTYLARIIRASGEALHVLDLVAQASRVVDSLTGQVGLGSDEKAKRAYKDRVRELELDIETAARDNDIGRLDQLRLERDTLIQELRYSYGLTGRSRPTRSPVERARISVRNRITAALAALESHHRTAHQHLSRSIATGTYCRYLPPAPTSWQVTVAQDA